MEELKEMLLEPLNNYRHFEHMVFVSLKYTRTSDMFLTILNKLYEVYESFIDAFLNSLVFSNVIDELPEQPIKKISLFKKYFNDFPDLDIIINRYQVLRKLKKLDYTSENEFRKKITVKYNLNGKDFIIDIPFFEQEYKNLTNIVRDFFEYFNNKYFKKDNEKENKVEQNNKESINI